MIHFNGKKFNISENCKKCGGLNEVIQTKGGDFEYYCDCFPCGSTRVYPHRIDKALKTRSYR